MKPNPHESELIEARRVMVSLAGYITGQQSAIILGEPHRAMMNALIAQFFRLDRKEQRQREAGQLGAEHGKKGGRRKAGV